MKTSYVTRKEMQQFVKQVRSIYRRYKGMVEIAPNAQSKIFWKMSVEHLEASVASIVSGHFHAYRRTRKRSIYGAKKWMEDKLRGQ